MLMSLFNEETLRKEYDESLKKKSKEEGRAEGRVEALIGLVKKNLISLASAASEANMTETEFANLPDMKAAQN